MSDLPSHQPDQYIRDPQTGELVSTSPAQAVRPETNIPPLHYEGSTINPALLSFTTQPQSSMSAHPPLLLSVVQPDDGLVMAADQFLLPNNQKNQEVFWTHRPFLPERLSYDNYETASKDALTAVRDRSIARSTAEEVLEASVQAQDWVRKLLEAFDGPHDQNPTVDYPVKVEVFRRFQNLSANRTVTAVQHRLAHNLLYAEQVVWQLFRKVLIGAEKGFLRPDLFWRNGLEINRNLTLAQRLEALVEVLRRFPVVRMGVVGQMRIDELVANPTGTARIFMREGLQAMLS